MAVVTADLELRAAELSDGSFEAFCDDIAAMFDADVTCTRQDVGTGTIKDLQKQFKKLASVHLVQATGILNGTFPLFFDQGGLFTLSGVIVMLPEKRIREEVKRGSIDDAENLTDAAREVGNLLVGSWDRVFREECEEHDHFLKTDTFIGKPWEDLSKVGIASAEEELLYVRYEMTVEPYPSFCCAAVFPKTILEPVAAKVAAEPEATPEPEAVVETPVAEAAVTSAAPAVAESPLVETPAVELTKVEAKPEEPKVAAEPVVAPSAAVPASQAPAEPQVASELAPAKQEPPVAVEPQEPIVQPLAPDIRDTVEAVVGKVEEEPPVTPVPRRTESQPKPESDSGYINHMFDDIVGYSSHSGISELLKVKAKDIMVPEVVWCKSDDTVQDVVAKMQQHNTGYVLVGQDGVIEGLVSNSNILGAMSPYLRPMFAKWRRQEDDATLEIKIKWVMSRPVRTVTPEATLASMIESMRRFGGRCLPVVDKQAQVQGMITVFDIMLRVLESDESFSWEGKPPQAPPLLI